MPARKCNVVLLSHTALVGSAPPQKARGPTFSSLLTALKPASDLLAGYSDYQVIDQSERQLPTPPAEAGLLHNLFFLPRAGGHSRNTTLCSWIAIHLGKYTNILVSVPGLHNIQLPLLYKKQFWKQNLCFTLPKSEQYILLSPLLQYALFLLSNFHQNAINVRLAWAPF